MTAMDEQILRTAKEIIVKFIEVGRISPATFDEAFRSIYKTVHSSVRDARTEPPDESDGRRSK